ncbi:MAG: restriction endonuclease subunit S [Shewanella sp.]
MTPGLDENKVFIIHRGNMQTRHDPYYYLPKFVRLEARVTTRSTAKLRDYVLAMSGGSTPKKEEEEKYYADAESGIPFVRVQNLNVDGHLSLEDVKYVNRETHEGLLNRSKVLQDDLLVKITGVGRMAVASVPPLGFEGNINQHIARIRTESRATSEALAVWLNSDIAETLAKRRSTGGTRPALDYPALRSIPVILDEQMQKELSTAYAQHNQAEAKASELLAGIDEYLMSELGITLPPELENTITNRIFRAQRQELAGWRFDPDMALYSKHTRTAKFNASKLKEHMRSAPQYGANERGVERLNLAVPRYVRITDVNEFGELSPGIGVAAEVAEDKYLLEPGDLLFARSGNTVGKTYLHTPSTGEKHVFAGYLIRFRLNAETLLPEYAFSYTLCSAYKEWCRAVQRATGQPNINAEEYKSLLIPVPPVEKQAEIAEKVFHLRNQARLLREQADMELHVAKRRIEAMLLGEVTV